jgi:hypothetical protein
MRAKLYVVIAMTFSPLMIGTASFGQCQGGANGPIPDYSFYATETTTNNGTTATVNITVSGETEDASCMDTGQHTPIAHMQIGSSSAVTQDGTPVIPYEYTTFTGTTSATVNPAQTYDLTEEGEIFCSVLNGIFWEVSGNPVSVPRYSASCGVVNKEIVLGCGFGGPGTCCNPTIKASEAFSTSGYSCRPDNCVQWVSGGVTYGTCCCSSVYVDPDCTTFLSSPFCTTEGTM